MPFPNGKDPSILVTELSNSSRRFQVALLKKTIEAIAPIIGIIGDDYAMSMVFIADILDRDRGGKLYLNVDGRFVVIRDNTPDTHTVERVLDKVNFDQILRKISDNVLGAQRKYEEHREQFEITLKRLGVVISQLNSYLESTALLPE